MNYKNTDFLAGVLLIAAFATILWVTIILGGHQGAIKEIFTGKENKSVTIQFENISGLEVNHAVKVQGHKFGKVTKIDLSKSGDVLVDVEFLSKVNFFEGYTIEIQDESVLGGKAIYINIGPKDGKQIENLYTSKAPILKGKPAGNLIAEGGNLIADNKNDIRDIVKNIKEITEKIKVITDKVNEGDGIIARVLNDGQLSEDVKQSIESINKILSKVKDGEGFLGKLINDDALYKDIQKLIKDAQSALEDFREQAPITTFAGTIMGAF